MDRKECRRQHKYRFFLLRLVVFICEAVPAYQNIFPDHRTKYWDSLSLNTLDKILIRIVRHTPCRILSQAFYRGLLTASKRIKCVIGHTLQCSEKYQARCLTSFFENYESK